MEEWKDIKGYEGLYQVSNFGRVKSLARNDASGHKLKERIMTNYIGVRGYFEVGLTKNGKNKTTKLHQLIAKSFIPNPENKPHINHKNGIKTDNSIENL